jgi:hypothetical protein
VVVVAWIGKSLVRNLAGLPRLDFSAPDSD